MKFKYFLVHKKDSFNPQYPVFLTDMQFLFYGCVSVCGLVCVCESVHILPSASFNMEVL